MCSKLGDLRRAKKIRSESGRGSAAGAPRSIRCDKIKREAQNKNGQKGAANIGIGTRSHCARVRVVDFLLRAQALALCLVRTEGHS